MTVTSLETYTRARPHKETNKQQSILPVSDGTACSCNWLGFLPAPICLCRQKNTTTRVKHRDKCRISASLGPVPCLLRPLQTWACMFVSSPSPRLLDNSRIIRSLLERPTENVPGPFCFPHQQVFIVSVHTFGHLFSWSSAPTEDSFLADPHLSFCLYPRVACCQSSHFRSSQYSFFLWE